MSPFLFFISLTVTKRVSRVFGKKKTSIEVLYGLTCSALNNEVIIPLDSEVLEECIEYEKRWMASLSEDSQEERNLAIKRIERLFDELCKRYGKESDVWVKYITLERSEGRYEKAQAVYNQALHSLPDLSEFEEKLSLLKRPL